MAHRDAADAGIADPVGARPGITEERQHLVVEREASALDELQHGDGGHGLRQARETEQARGLHLELAFLVGEPVAAHQEQLVLASHREPGAGDVPLPEQRRHELVVGLEPGERRARRLRVRLEGAEDDEQDGDGGEPLHAFFDASKIARGFLTSICST